LDLVVVGPTQQWHNGRDPHGRGSLIFYNLILECDPHNGRDPHGRGSLIFYNLILECDPTYVQFDSQSPISTTSTPKEDVTVPLNTVQIVSTSTHLFASNSELLLSA
jgi:hypothetical protein